MKDAGCLPLQWELHSGDQTEVDQILHQGLLVLQAADDSAAAGQLQVLPTGRRHFLQLGQRLRLHDLRVRSVGQSGGRRCGSARHRPADLCLPC